MKWKIYYSDGSTYSDEDGPPELAPSLDIQIIVQKDEEVGRHIIAGAYPGKDYFWFENGEWYVGDMFGVFDYLMRCGAVKFGRTIGNAQFKTIQNKAINDSDFPTKSAFKENERR